MNSAMIREALLSMRDDAFSSFQSNLIPTIAPDRIIGVRTPAMRSLAKTALQDGEYEAFLSELPHVYFEENQVHALILSGLPDFDTCIYEIDRFLPFIDSWATCDTLSPKIFRKNHEQLTLHVRRWLNDDHTYAKRFGIKMLMDHYMNDDFSPVYPELVSRIRSDEYYVNMMIAWYFATALAKQYELVIPFIEEKKLSRWTHNKAIQKAIESYRVTQDHKEHLKTLRV